MRSHGSVPKKLKMVSKRFCPGYPKRIGSSFQPLGPSCLTGWRSQSVCASHMADIGCQRLSSDGMPFQENEPFDALMERCVAIEVRSKAQGR